MAKGENIFKRKDGRWEARYVRSRYENGRIRYGFCYGKTYAEAKEKVTRAKADILNDRDSDSSVRTERFAFYCDGWLKLRSTRLKASSYMKYQAAIDNHIKPYLGSLFPRDITTEKIFEFSQYLLNKKNLSVKTVRDILTFVRSVYFYAGKRIENGLPDIEIAYPRESARTIRVLTEGEEEALILYLAQEMDNCKFAVYLALRTGMRIGEICALKWKDISFSEEAIHVNATVQRIKNTALEGASKTMLLTGTPKSEKSRRTIPLMPDVKVLCRRFPQNSPECFVLTGTESCMEPRRLQRHLKRYAKECGIEDIHFHTLRHTFATRCIESGFDVKTLSEILGHSSTSVTLDRYVHPNMNLKRENMNRLKIMDCFLSGQSKGAVNL